MRPGKQFGFTAVEQGDIWRRWKAGQSLHEIGRAFDKPHSCIRCLLLPRGGIPPITRRRSRLALTLAEREDISRGLASRSPLREIARRLNRTASTVSREISRHGGRPTYRAHAAHDLAWNSALRPKKCLLAVSPKLRNIVTSKLILDWSPEQISGWLKIQFPDDASMRVSHEMIYRSLFIQARGVLKKELMNYLRSKRRMRRSRHATASGQSRGQIVDATSIRERPAEVEDRAIPGHWEGGSTKRRQEQLYRDAGRTPFTLRDADQGTEQRNRRCRCCLEPARSQATVYAETLADVGSRTGDGKTQGFHGSYRCAGLLLRSAKSVAARHERKHQSAPAAILPAPHRSVWLFSRAARPGLPALESTTEKDLRIPHSCG